LVQGEPTSRGDKRRDGAGDGREWKERGQESKGGKGTPRTQIPESALAAPCLRKIVASIEQNMSNKY